MDPQKRKITANTLDSAYWNNRYVTDEIGWDIGYSNAIHTAYVEKNCSKDTKILVPGAGSGYEVEYLWSKGYTNVHAIDFSPVAKEQFLKRVPDFEADQYLVGDFFELKDQFDLILEQTFFCALDPTLRKKYTTKMHDTLLEQGKIFGVLFNFEKPEGPPFGGSIEEYESLFSPYFNILKMAASTESIPQRQGNELIIELQKK